MSGPAYPPARAVAARVHAHFQRHAAGRSLEGVHLIPDVRDVEGVIDAAFWASLRRSEGYVPRISIALLAPEQAARPLTFARSLPLDPTMLVQLAPAVERPGIHLGVRRNSIGLEVWGATRTLPASCFVLEVAAPGLLVVKHGRADGSGKYVNLAVLEGDQVKVLDERALRLPECPDLLTSLLGFPTAASAESLDLLTQLAVSMRAHGRGGSLLVVPPGEDWRSSILPHIPYAVVPPFQELGELLRADEEERGQRAWREALRHAVDAMAGLTAVDGATLMTRSYELLAFGAKISRRKGAATVERVIAAEPVEGGTPAVVEPAQLGGTRHQSAAQFVQDQHDALAMVASQDGRFTLFSWSPSQELVHAYRVEALLL